MALPPLPAYLDQVRAFIAGDGETFATEIERTGAVPPALLARVRELGLTRLTLPREYGGEGLSLTDYFPILEACAQGHGSLRILVHGINTMWRPLAYATPDLRQGLLTAIATGRCVPGFALTEPDTGTGADIGTRAQREGDTYYLTGRKHLITFADIGDVFTVVAGAPGGISAFVVQRGAPGFSITYMPPMMGMRGSEHGVLEFDRTPVPVSHRLGEEGQGLEVALRGFLDQSRAAIAITCVGLAQRALDLSVAFAKERVTFGRPIAQRQAIQMHLAEMATDIAAARHLAMDAARHYDAGQPLTTQAAMAKLFGLEMVGRVTDAALRIFGGRGLTTAFPIERIYRDARTLWFEEGTAEIQKTVIARALLDDKTGP